MVQCLQKMHLEKPIYEGPEPVVNRAPVIGVHLRMVAKHFRNLKSYPDKFETCAKQALSPVPRRLGNFVIPHNPNISNCDCLEFVQPVK